MIVCSMLAQQAEIIMVTDIPTIHESNRKIVKMST